MSLLWYATRGSAVVSLLLLTAVMVLGILGAGRWRSAWPRFVTQDLHRTIALLSLIFLAIHIVTSIIDPFTSLGIPALIPFAAAYRRLYLGLGAVALYLLLALIGTSLVRNRLGHRTWEAIHWAAYGFWPIALVHGIGTGSDAAAAWYLALEAACVIAVALASGWRIRKAVRRIPLAGLVPSALALDDSRLLNPAMLPGGAHLEAGTLQVSTERAGGAPSGSDRLLAGPPAAAGAEGFADHQARLGPRPRGDGGTIVALERAGLLGRGGAGFPVGRKWRSVAERSGGQAVILANGAEGKPTSRKDRALMAMRPHLVMDGALLAAESVGADEVVLFVGTEHEPALRAMQRALGERRDGASIPMRLVQAPLGYVVGEASAAVHYLNENDARPTMAPPRTFEAGVHGQPTVVQNVESLAYAALIARFGPDWYRTAGRGKTAGTALVTVSGTTPAQRVIEIEYGTALGDVLDRVGAWTVAGQGAMLGDSFGAWADLEAARDLALDPVSLREAGMSFGAGVVAVIPEGTCGVVQTARVLRFMAGESAGQCGPCVFGLRGLAEVSQRIADRRPQADDFARLERWGGELAGRGACAHPDGALAFLASGVRVFADEFERHRRGQCSMAS